MHTHTCICYMPALNTYTHIRKTHAHLHLNTHACYAHQVAQMHLRIDKCMCPFAPILTRTCTCTHICACIHTYIHTYIHACIHTYIRTYIHTYLHTHIVTYIHTYIHVHTIHYTGTKNIGDIKAYNKILIKTHIAGKNLRISEFIFAHNRMQTNTHTQGWQTQVYIYRYIDIYVGTCAQKYTPARNRTCLHAFYRKP